jgi:hypothetical protein
VSCVGPNEHKPSVDEPIEPNGGNVCDGNKAPGLRNTFVVFFRFFHFALNFEFIYNFLKLLSHELVVDSIQKTY